MPFKSALYAATSGMAGRDAVVESSLVPVLMPDDTELWRFGLIVQIYKNDHREYIRSNRREGRRK
jgi:hypothetical protein